MNLVFNKPLLDNTSKVFDIFFRPTHKPAETTIKVYGDAINGDTIVTVPTQYILFASASFVNILDKINSAYWSESFDVAAQGERVKILTNTILNGTESQRNSAFDKFVQMGILTSGEVTMSKALVSRMLTFDPSLMVRSFDANEKIYKYSYNIPLGLEKKYDQVRNTQKEKLYLVFVGRGHSNFGYVPVTGETYGYFTKYWNDLFQKDSLAMGFVAVDLGDLTTPEEEAIKYDHLDIVEYFDNIQIQIKIPNKYN